MRRVLIPLAELTAAQVAGTQPLVGGPGCLTWHSTYETTGAATASYELYDQSITSGQLLAPVTLAANESTRDFIGLHALPFLGGLWYKQVSGSVGGSFTAWVDHVCEEWYDFERMLKTAGAIELGKQLGIGS